MSYSPTPLQTLFLWRLLVEGGEGFKNQMKPELGAKDRRMLENSGLIVSEPRKVPGKKRGRPLFITLTERGWEWAASHLDAEISTRSNAAAPVLHAIMTRLKSHLQCQQVSLADFLCDQASPGDIASRVRQAYAHLSGGRWGVRVRLADIRAALADIRGASLDEILHEMEANRTLVLYPMDDPQEIRPEDESAALPNSVGDPRHIAYMEG